MPMGENTLFLCYPSVSNISGSLLKNIFTGLIFFFLQSTIYTEPTTWYEIGVDPFVDPLHLCTAFWVIAHFHAIHAHETITNLPEWRCVESRRLEQRSANCEQCQYYSECGRNDQQKTHGDRICTRYTDNEHPKEGVLSSLYWTWESIFIRSIFILHEPEITSWKVWTRNMQLSKQMPEGIDTPPFFRYMGCTVRILILKEAKS